MIPDLLPTTNPIMPAIINTISKITIDTPPDLLSLLPELKLLILDLRKSISAFNFSFSFSSSLP